MNIYLLNLQCLTIPNKYTNWYIKICQNAINRNFTKTEANDVFEAAEIHHIMPRSFTNDNNPNNLVCLSLKEHYIVHHLLTKMIPTSSKNYNKMMYAFNLISNTKKIYAYEYVKLKLEVKRLQREDPNSGIFVKGCTRTPESILKQKESIRSSKSFQAALKCRQKNLIGKKKGPRSTETKAIISQKLSGRKLDDSNIKKRQETRKNNLIGFKTWRIINQQTGEIFIVTNLTEWCNDRNIDRRRLAPNQLHKKTWRIEEYLE